MPTTLTPIYQFRLRDLDDRLWHDDVNNNFRSLEALLNAAFNVEEYKGTWANSTRYEIGDRAVDVSTSTIYQCVVAHTSAATGSFSDDRVSNPSYWQSFTYTSASVDELIARSLRYPTADSDTLSAELPIASVRAGKLLGFDGNGEPLMVAVSVAAGVTVSALWTTVLDDTSLSDSLTSLGVSAGVKAFLLSAGAATETLAGVLEVATTAEVNAGTDDARAITPLKLAARLASISSVESFVITVVPETLALAAGTSLARFPMPYAFTVQEVFAVVDTAQATGGLLTIDVNAAGASILGTRITLDNTETSSLTAATPPTITTANIAKGAKVSIDLDSIGDGTAKGLSVVIVGVKQ